MLYDAVLISKTLIFSIFLFRLSTSKPVQHFHDDTQNILSKNNLPFDVSTVASVLTTQPSTANVEKHLEESFVHHSQDDSQRSGPDAGETIVQLVPDQVRIFQNSVVSILKEEGGGAQSII